VEFGKGIQRIQEIIDLGVEYGFIEKGGAWFNFLDQELNSKERKVKQFLLDIPRIFCELESKILEKLNHECKF